MNVAWIGVVLGLVATLWAQWAGAQEPPRAPEVEIETHGVFTNITIGGSESWSGIIKKVQALRQVPRERDAGVVAMLTRDLDGLPPPFAYELIRRTCVSNPEKAAYLFALTGGRLRYDAMRCVDQTARAGVQATLFALRMPECKEMLTNLDLNLRSMAQVRDGKDLFSSKASHWWICSHGMQAISAAMEKKTLAASDWLKPESEWPSIQKEIKEQIDYTIEKHSKK
jgi:hypothetical protein